jgi:succinate dehydrogenase / fumarate reductase flavoprotein subunit
MELLSHEPTGPIEKRWDQLRHEAGEPGQQAQIRNHRRRNRPTSGRRHRRRRLASLATLSELGYNVKASATTTAPPRPLDRRPGRDQRRQELPERRRQRLPLFYDTVKGGDFRSREANVYRLAEVSVNIIDQCVAQGVPFAREYGGLLANRSFGGAQVSAPSTPAARPASSSCSAPTRRSPARSRWAGRKCTTRTEMLDVVVDGHGQAASSPATWSPARSERTRPTPWCWPPAATATSSSSRPTPWPATSPQPGGPIGGRVLRQPLLHPDPPDLHPGSGDYQSKLTLMSESLRNDGRIWVPKARTTLRRAPTRSRRTSATTTSSGSTRASATWSRATSPPGPPSGVRRGPRRRPRSRTASTSTSPTPSSASARTRSERYGNLFDMYERITGEDPYKCRCEIYPAPLHHGRAVGGLQPDDHRPGPLRASAKPTSPITAPTASGPAP